MDAGGPRTAAAEQGHAAAHSCGSLRGHACGGGADPQYQRQTAGATVDAPTDARRVGHARRLVPTPAHAAKVHKPAWASTQKRGQLPMRWSSESGKKTCSQVDASTEAGFMHSYVVGHIGPDPSQPSILRNGDRGRRESSRQVTTPYRCHVVAEYSPEYFRDFDPGGGRSVTTTRRSLSLPFQGLSCPSLGHWSCLATRREERRRARVFAVGRLSSYRSEYVQTGILPRFWPRPR